MGAFLVVQWMRIHLPRQRTWVPSLVRDDPPCHSTSASSTTTESVLQSLGAEPLSPGATTPDAPTHESPCCTTRSHQNESPVHRNGKSSSHSPQLEKSLQQS